MRFKVQVIGALLAFALASGIACAEADNAATYSHSELKKMVREAHTTEQYRVLASYYRMRQQQFTDQAHDEVVWFAKNKMYLSRPVAKAPTAIDFSRNRCEYYRREEQKMSQEAAHYEYLADGANR